MADNKKKVIENLTKNLLKHLGLITSFSLEIDKEGVAHIDIKGEDLGVLIGYHGESLSSLQIILGLAAYKKLGEWTPLIVDVEGYRKEREEKLKKLAQNAADKARFLAEPIALFPMPAFERRIIHLAISNIPDVESESEGEGRERRVIVRSKK